jgi:hypothetical protein
MNTKPNDPKGAAGALKCPLGLIPPKAMDETAWVHDLGAEKYGPFNWRVTGVCASTYVNAILRHLNAWRDGEDNDPESGRTHLAHIACCCNILIDAAHNGTLDDDRNRSKAKKVNHCNKCNIPLEYNHIYGWECPTCHVGPDPYHP